MPERAEPILLAGGVLTQLDDERPVDVMIEDGSIVSVTDAGEGASGAHERVDLGGLRLAPGFIDLQVNGADGIDLASRPEGMAEVATWLATHGVTSFLPTLISPDDETIDRALAAWRDHRRDGRGARILGWHIEGPALAPARRGAHPAERLRMPGDLHVGGWTPAGGVRLVTLAPELPGAHELVRALTVRGVVVAAGHSGADFEQMGDAIDAGVSMVTHLFNAMPAMHHRAPGIVGKALTDTRLRCGLIVDGVHVDPAVVAVAFAALGPHRTVLVSDSIAAAGEPDGRFVIAGIDVEVVGGHAHQRDGRLAGSTLSLDTAVRNLVAFTGCSPAAAVMSASATPAAVLGESLGRIEVGCPADLVVLDDGLGVVATMIAGAPAHDPSGLFG